MILIFRHKGLEVFFRTGRVSGIQVIHQKRLRDLLTALNAANDPSYLGHPSWRLYKLAGGLSGFYALTIQANWRLTFRFVENDVELLDYLDYH
jgi:proteic killer suppression protein